MKNIIEVLVFSPFHFFISHIYFFQVSLFMLLFYFFLFFFRFYPMVLATG